MKTQLKKIAKTMAGWPVIGYFINIGIVVIRLPQFRASYLDLERRQRVFEIQQLPRILGLEQRQDMVETQQLPRIMGLEQRQDMIEAQQLPRLLSLEQRQDMIETQQLAKLMDLEYRQREFDTQQLPPLLQTISELNDDHLLNDDDRNNLIQSAPVALRKITRDLIEMQKQFESVSSSIGYKK